jgi:lysophospholipase L1-like esterase
MTRLRVRLAALVGVILVQFGLFEGALRLVGGSEAAPAFQQLFLRDPVIGYRLRPSTAIRFTTADFSTDISINSAGVRDAEIGPKPAGERRIVVLGDSLVLAVQVPIAQTFCKRLEARLNQRSGGTRYRVIDAGVQGYGPVEEALFYERVASRLGPDLVLVVTFVANDAVEAAGSAARLRGAGGMVPVSQALLDRTRHLVRRSMVLQIVNQRISQLRERFRFGRPAQPDPRLLTYATPVSPELARGLEVSREAIGRIAKGASAKGSPTAIVLMPARLQLDDDEFARMRALVEPAGYHMTVDGATTLFENALRPLGLPMLDLLPAFRGAADPRAVFFGSTVHLTPAGHQLVADALTTFLDAHHLVP